MNDALPPSEDNVGYCAVIMPDIDYYQAFFIQDTDMIKAIAFDIRMRAMSVAKPDAVYGAIQAAFVESALLRNDSMSAGTSLALFNMSGHQYFYVKSSRNAGGTLTELLPINANSIEEARDFIHALPEVRKIQRRLLRSMNKRH